MADLRRQRLRARTLTSAAIAVAAHVVLILALAVGIHVAHAPNETPPIEVSLVKLFTPRPKAAPRPSPARAQAEAKPVAAPVSRPTPAPVTPIQPLPEAVQVDPRIAAAEAVRSALQATVHCAHPDAFNMTPTERELCAQHIRELRAGAPTYAIGPHLAPLVASHGMTAVSHLSPRPGTDLGPLDMGPVRGVSH